MRILTRENRKKVKLTIAFFSKFSIIGRQASLAQLVVHFTRNEGVAGSSPAGSSMEKAAEALKIKENAAFQLKKL